MDNRYNRHNRRKCSLKVHIVLVTKYRKRLFVNILAEAVKKRIYDICSKNKKVKLEASSHHLKVVGFRLQKGFYL